MRLRAEVERLTGAALREALPKILSIALRNVQEHTSGEPTVGEFVWWSAVTWPEWATKIVMHYIDEWLRARAAELERKQP